MIARVAPGSGDGLPSACCVSHCCSQVSFKFSLGLQFPLAFCNLSSPRPGTQILLGKDPGFLGWFWMISLTESSHSRHITPLPYNQAWKRHLRSAEPPVTLNTGNRLLGLSNSRCLFDFIVASTWVCGPCIIHSIKLRSLGLRVTQQKNLQLRICTQVCSPNFQLPPPRFLSCSKL